MSLVARWKLGTGPQLTGLENIVRTTRGTDFPQISRNNRADRPHPRMGSQKMFELFSRQPKLPPDPDIGQAQRALAEYEVPPDARSRDAFMALSMAAQTLRNNEEAAGQTPSSPGELILASSQAARAITPLLTQHSDWILRPSVPFYLRILGRARGYKRYDRVLRRGARVSKSVDELLQRMPSLNGTDNHEEQAVVLQPVPVNSGNITKLHQLPQQRRGRQLAERLAGLLI